MILISLQKPFLVVFATNSTEKSPEFLAKIFFLGGRGIFAINVAEAKPEFLARTFLFWFAGIVPACWNLVMTECGPLV